MPIIKSEEQLFQWTKKQGSFPVWVLDRDGNKFYGDSFELCLTLAGDHKFARSFPCKNENGDSYELFDEQIIDYDINHSGLHYLKEI